MEGRRRYDLAPDQYHLLMPGEYMKAEWWVACTPVNASFPEGALANLSRHDVVEHSDGTITVSPSILVTGGVSWHGFLERGVWREC